MSLTSQDLASFNTFVVAKLTSGTADSMAELARQWEAERHEFDETVAELRESIADMEMSRGRLLTDIAADMRKKYNIPTAAL